MSFDDGCFRWRLVGTTAAAGAAVTGSAATGEEDEPTADAGWEAIRAPPWPPILALTSLMELAAATAGAHELLAAPAETAAATAALL